MSRSPSLVSPMKRVYLIARGDVVRTVRDKLTFVWMLLLPVAMMWVLGQVGTGPATESSGPEFTLTIVQQDEGWIGDALARELHADDVIVETIDAAPTGGPTQRPAMVLTFPPKMTQTVLAGEQVPLDLDLGPGVSFSEAPAVEVHVQRTLLRVLGRLLILEAPADGELAARYDALAAAPALARLEVSSAGRGRPIPSGYGQSVPGMLTMTVLMMTLIYGGIFLITEKTAGMLRRQASLPISRGQIVLGKIVGRLVIAGVQCVMLFAVAKLVFNLDLGDSPAGLAVMVAGYAFAVAGLATLLGAVLSRPEQAASLGWILSMILAGLGGCLFPAEVMPAGLRTAVHVLPTAWAMDGFHALISYGQGLEAVLTPAAVLCGFGLLFSFLASRWLRVV